MDCDTDDGNRKRTLPICFNPDPLALLEEFAKKKGMTSHSQAVEYLATQNNHQ
jgi:hypothetical protein